MLLNSHQSLQQAMQSMSDITKSDLEFPTLTFEDGSLDEIILTEMIGNVMISKTSLDEKAEYTTAGGHEVIVVKGDITALDVDVIVNGANKNLNHSDGLAKVLITKGGKSIQDECDQYISHHGQLSEGECFSSKPGTLKCQMIVHAVGPSWQGGSNREEDLLQKCVERAIVETEKDKYTTIAIPALCTGIFGYPANQATRAIAQAVRDYFKRSKTSTIKTVYLCDVNDSSVDLFVKAGDKMFGQVVDGGRRPSGGGNRHSEQTEKEEPTEAQSSSPNAEYLGEENPVQQEEKDEDRDEGKPEEKLRKTTMNMLKVTKLPPGTTAEFLENFFENTRKFGGGDIKDVEYDEDTASAIITFEEDEAVEIVLKKIPILFKKKAIEVSAHNVNEEEPMEIIEEYESNLSTSEPAPTCTIEVRGMTDRTTQDTIMYYFESRKGADVDVDTIEYIEDKDMYLVTFQDEQAVDRVLEKSNMVDGTTLQVKKHIPPKIYPNKALVKGFNPKTTKDGIINFLEARTNLDVEEVDFGDEDSGKAIVTFCKPIDIGDIQTACKKRALDDSYLTVHPVVVTNCIVVRDFSERTTESELEYYFDNKRKSGVEGVTDVQMNKDGDYCVIYFDIAEDALLACKRSHTIDNCTLNVKVFYDCLGVPADDEGPKFKSLPPLVITDLDRYKVNFLKNSAQYKEALERQLELNHAKITWPSSMSDSKIVIECILTKESEDCRKQSWEDDIKRQLSTHVDALVTEKHSTLQEAWSGVIQKLREINISYPEDVSVSVGKPPACEIIVVGHKKTVKEVSDHIKLFINK